MIYDQFVKIFEQNMEQFNIQKMENINKLYLYGAGMMAVSTLQLLFNKNLKVSGFVDINKSLEGKLIDDIAIIHPEHLSMSQKRDSVFLVSMTAAPYCKVRDYLWSLGIQHIYPVGDFVQMLYPDRMLANIWNIMSEEKDLIEIFVSSFNSFDDELSRYNYFLATKWFVLRDDKIINNDLFSIKRNKYFIDEVCKSSDIDTFLDTAVLDGSYINKFITNWSNRFKSVYGFTLNLDSYDSLVQRYKEDERIKFFNIELGEYKEKVDTVRTGLMIPYNSLKMQQIYTDKLDNLMQDNKYDFVRGYSMSPVFPIIRGAIQSIKEYHPVLAINIGHYKEDFIGVFPYLRKELDGYSYFFREHSYQGNDCILYAIPKRRML